MSEVVLPLRRLNLIHLRLTRSMAQDLLPSWLQLMRLVPVVEEKAEVAGDIFCHSLCASLIVAVQVTQPAGASQTQHGPCKNIQGVYEIKTKILDLPRYFCNCCFCCTVLGLWQCITKISLNSL
jgi:hypothetical protein